MHQLIKTGKGGWLSVYEWCWEYSLLCTNKHLSNAASTYSSLPLNQTEKIGKFVNLRYDKILHTECANRWRENLAKLQVKNLPNLFWQRNPQTWRNSVEQAHKKYDMSFAGLQFLFVPCENTFLPFIQLLKTGLHSLNLIFQHCRALKENKTPNLKLQD